LIDANIDPTQQPVCIPKAQHTQDKIGTLLGQISIIPNPKCHHDEWEDVRLNNRKGHFGHAKHNHFLRKKRKDHPK
jgi:hypothetical protein